LCGERARERRATGGPYLKEGERYKGGGTSVTMRFQPTEKKESDGREEQRKGERNGRE